MLDVLPPELLTSIVDHTATNDQLNTSLVSVSKFHKNNLSPFVFFLSSIFKRMV